MQSLEAESRNALTRLTIVKSIAQQLSADASSLDPTQFAVSLGTVSIEDNDVIHSNRAYIDRMCSDCSRDPRAFTNFKARVTLGIPSP